MMRRVLLCLLVILAAGSTTAQEEGSVVGRPELALSATDNHFTASEDANLSVTVSNSGDIDRGGPQEFEERVTTARNVRLNVSEGSLPSGLAGSFDVKTGTVFAGSVPEGVAGPFGFRVEIGDDVEPGTYEVPVEVTYDYTNVVDYAPATAPEYSDGTRTVTETVTVVIENDARFELSTPDGGAVSAGDTDEYRFAIENVGNQPASEVEVGLSARNSSLFFGDPEAPQEATSVYVPRLDPGESRTLTVTVGTGSDTAPDSYPVDAVVSYQDPSGIARQSDPLQFGVAVAPNQSFTLRNVSSTLRVDDSGFVRGRIVNEGERVTNAAVVYEGEEPNLVPRETEYAVGTLDPGEAAPFEFRFDATGEAAPGPRQLPFSVRYRNENDDLRTSDSVDATAVVGPELDEFRVESICATVAPGDQSRLELRVTNTANETLTDVDAKLFTTDPLSTDDDEAFIARLEPNESARLTFLVSADGSALEKVYPVSVDFSYEDEFGDTQLSDTYRVPVRVVDQPNRSPSPLLIGLAAVIVVIVLALLWWRRDAIRR